jgi:hypothetical protein
MNLSLHPAETFPAALHSVRQTLALAVKPIKALARVAGSTAVKSRWYARQYALEAEFPFK